MRKPKEFITTKMAPQEMLKGLLQSEKAKTKNKTM